ncbi:MAG TPA: nicotinate-nucleotide adenylyltransferase [Syntrophorhabdaceae bacterium]|nr:nicotinate-nucleotide adenylyltransferase [Syntrophorhabdaceae bacterium]
MAIGIFGGTFDPVHFGHLRIAEEIRETFSLERIYFVPARIPPHKKGRKIAAAAERFAMVKSATRDNKFFRVSDIEIRREGPSYTIDTLSYFEKRFKELYFLIGADAFAEIETWHLYPELFRHADFVVLTRPSGASKTIPEMLPQELKRDMNKMSETLCVHNSGRKIHLHRVTPIHISSTEIKELLKSGRSIRYLVPASVEKIITARGLYKG